ncbi:hypothetical protein K435DRAFT_862352 [Dendrothele bispora CBS 962.96]|uniref:Nephrocystin 3-like N-terminal domain-containing protein n=1 Tax=Dendrothele bispora (strain CBS 962.96) TaxID=1314807 RepID=A0A4S8LSQ3_DENBC|nr:hypothetical protein K435DRAFT_862352 [Dendrothele bispora CBS 962.96]
MDQSETEINRKHKSLQQSDGTLGPRQKKSNTLATSADNLPEDNSGAIAQFDDNASSFGRSTNNMPSNNTNTVTQVQQSDAPPLGTNPSTVTSPGETESQDRDMLDRKRTGTHGFEHAHNNQFVNSCMNITGGDSNLTQIYYSESELAKLEKKMDPIRNPAKKLMNACQGPGFNCLENSKHGLPVLKVQPRLPGSLGLLAQLRKRAPLHLSAVIPSLRFTTFIQSPFLSLSPLPYIKTNYGKKLIATFDEDISLKASGLPVHQQLSTFLSPDELIDQIDKNIVIIIDGLDEWGTDSDRQILLQGLLNLCKNVSRIKMVITSRPAEDINQAMNSSLVRIFNLDKSYDIDSDIKVYIDSWLENVPIKLSPSQIEKLIKKADGLFIWIVTALLYVKSGMNLKARLTTVISTEQAKNAAQNPYQALDTLYSKVLEGVFSDEENAGCFKTVMSVLLVTEEPISIGTLGRMLDVEGTTVDRFHYLEKGIWEMVNQARRWSYAVVKDMHKSVDEGA